MKYPTKVDAFYFILILSLVFAFLGYIFSNMIFRNMNENLYRKEQIVIFLENNMSLLKKVHFYFIIIGILGVLIVYMKLFSQVSLNYYLENQASVKTDIDRSVIGIHLSAFSYVALMLGTMLTMTLKKKKYFIIPLVLIVLYSFSFYGRFPIFIGLVMAYFMYEIISYLEKKKKNLMKFFIIGFIATLLSFSFLAHTIESRISEYGINYDPYRDYVSSETKEFFDNFSFIFASNRASSLTYAYLFNPISTLNYWVDHANKLEYGRNSFPYIYRVMLKLDIVENRDNFTGNQKSVGEMGFQLPTYLGGVYKDFRYFGIIFFPFLFLFISSYLYFKLIKYNNIFAILLLPILLTFIVFSPLIFVFKEVIIFDVLLIIFVICFYLDYKRRRFF